MFFRLYDVFNGESIINLDMVKEIAFDNDWEQTARGDAPIELGIIKLLYIHSEQYEEFKMRVRGGEAKNRYAYVKSELLSKLGIN